MPTARWPTNRLLDLLEIDLPIIQAPMAGAQGVGACRGGVGGGRSRLASLRDADRRRRARGGGAHPRATNRGFQMNFFCHSPPEPDPAAEATVARAARRATMPSLASSRRAPAARAARAVRRSVLRTGRGSAAEGRELPLRSAARRSSGARARDWTQAALLRHHRPRGALPCGQGRRRDHRAGRRRPAAIAACS